MQVTSEATAVYAPRPSSSRPMEIAAVAAPVFPLPPIGQRAVLQWIPWRGGLALAVEVEVTIASEASTANTIAAATEPGTEAGPLEGDGNIRGAQHGEVVS